MMKILSTYSYLWEYVSVKIDPFLTWHVSVNVLLKVLVRDLIAVLELSIVIALLLHGVISQVYESVAQIFKIKLHT